MNEYVHKEIVTFFEHLNMSTPEIKEKKDHDLNLLVVDIQTTEGEQFLENNRELLLSFNTILKKILERKGVDLEGLTLSINGEQEKFIQEAKQKALIAYERVLKYEKPYEFGYLNGFERMIIHSYLKNKTEVQTISQGVGRERRLKVVPKSP